MRGSPSCEVTVRRFALWQGAVALASTAALACTIAWVALVPQGPGTPGRFALLLLALAAVATAASLFGMHPVRLRWDGSGWSLAPASSGPGEPIAGELEVALDLGFFMLLRFLPAPGSPRRSARWIPAQRRGLEREWHAFACAVYSPRPAAGAGAADPRFPE